MRGGPNRRFNCNYKKLKKKIDKGAEGHLKEVQLGWYH